MSAKKLANMAADLLEESYALRYMNKRAWRLWCAGWRAKSELVVGEIRKL